MLTNGLANGNAITSLNNLEVFFHSDPASQNLQPPLHVPRIRANVHQRLRIQRTIRRNLHQNEWQNDFPAQIPP